MDIYTKEAKEWAEAHDPLDAETFREYNGRFFLRAVLAECERLKTKIKELEDEVEYFSDSRAHL